MDWLNNPNEVRTRDACPLYICTNRKTDNETPCVVYLCLCKACIVNY